MGCVWREFDSPLPDPSIRNYKLLTQGLRPNLHRIDKFINITKSKGLELAERHYQLCTIVYILRGPKNHLYVGSSTNVIKRINRHKIGDGAEFTKRNKVFKLVYEECYKSLTEARRREKQIKGWRREKKENLIKYGHPIKKMINNES
jgi:putative endonuclease